ncbi:MAG: hypothetical protein ACE5JN_07715 [Candidatus Methylomirabilia bacterium]
MSDPRPGLLLDETGWNFEGGMTNSAIYLLDERGELPAEAIRELRRRGQAER